MPLLKSLAASLAALSPLMAQQLSEVEPNDTPAQANQLAVGNQLNANLVATEADWYTFTLPTAGCVNLYTNGLDTRMELWDATGTILLGNDDDGRGSANAFASSLFLNVSAGTYLVKIVGYSATIAGDYSIDLALFSAKPYSGAEVEPNNDATSATPVAIPAGSAQINASLAAPTLILSDVANAGSSTTITQATAGLVAGAWTPATIGYGRYYVKYTSGVNAGLLRQISANTATSITHAAYTTAPAAGDTYEVVLVDVDYYSFTIAQQSALWFQVTEGDAPFVCGHRYEIYDAAGNPLTPTSNTTGPAYGTNAGNSSSLSARTSQVRVYPAGTYMIAIRPPASPLVAPFDTLREGNYRLEIFELKMLTGATVNEVEPNDVYTSATPIAPGQVGVGYVNSTSGPDSKDVWGPIVITSPSTITYQTARNGATPMADSTIKLLNATGAVALTSTTGNLLSHTSHARGAVSFGLPGIYYLEVSGGGTNTTTQQGGYQLEVSELIDIPYQSASYSLTAANSACGTAPFPTIGLKWTSERPTLGTLFSRTVTNCPPGTLLLMAQGLSNEVMSNQAPLPLDLGSYGATGCVLNVDPAMVLGNIADGNGVATFDTLLPADRALRGIPIFEQAFVFNPTANAAGLQVSNYGRILTGERPF